MIIKTLYFVLFFCISYASAFCQNIAIVNVSNNNLDYISTAYFSEYQIIVEGAKCNDIKVEGENIELYKYRNCLYFIRGINKKKDANLILYNIISEDTILEQPLFFKDSIKDPTLEFNGSERMELGTVISKTTDSIYFVSPFKDKFNKGISYEVLSFNIGIEYDGKMLYYEPVIGNKIPPKFKNYLSLLKPTDKIIFSNISVVDEYGNKFKISKKVFHVDGR